MKYFIYFSATGNGDYLAEQLKDYGYTPVKVENYIITHIYRFVNTFL